MRLFIAIALACWTAAAASAAPATLPAPLKPYEGKVVYVDFWASWCGPCAQSFPWLNQMQQKYAGRLVVVGVNVDTDAAAADRFLQQHPARFDIVRDPAGTLPERYKIPGMPSAVLLGADGRVVHEHSGFRTKDLAEYEAAIRAALPEAAQ